MKNIGRTIIAVLAGAGVWAVLWIGGTQAAAAAFPKLLAAGQPVTHAGALIGLIVYSLPLSMLAGYVTAAVWYHLVCLALIVPATLYGGALRVRRRQTQPAYMT